MLIGTQNGLKRCTDMLDVKLNGIRIEQTAVTKCLGVMVDCNLNFKDHIDYICKKVKQKLAFLCKLRQNLTNQQMIFLFNAYILPHLQYCSTVWGSRSRHNDSKLTKIFNRGARLVNNSTWDTPMEEVLYDLGLINIMQRLSRCDAIMVYKCLNNEAPPYLCNKFLSFTQEHSHKTRLKESNGLRLPPCRTDFYCKSFVFRGIKIWNNLSETAKNCQNLNSFKRNLVI